MALINDNGMSYQAKKLTRGLIAIAGVLLFLLMISACIPPTSVSPPPTSTRTFTATFSSTPRPSATSSTTLTTTSTPSSTPTQTATLTASVTQTATPSATNAILRGEVNVPHVSCFYGPHKSYLYKYGLVGGSNLEIIGYNEDTQYIQIQAIGGSNPCWMNLEWMNVKGDITTVARIDPLTSSLPASPYYGALSGVTASHDGEKVTISWNFLYISPGKDSEQFPYLVEAWVCQQGKIKFTPVGTYQNFIELVDETNCERPSHARVYGVEKHGYTVPVEVTWFSKSD